MFNSRSYRTDSTPKGIIEKLNNLSIKARKRSNFVIDTNLFSLICDVEILKLAYENLKSKPGNLTPGIVPETLDDMNLELLNSISNEIKNESFKFKPTRKTFIPKKDGRQRNLFIAPPRDKLVQEAIKLILTAIYEPVFLDCSHGFRPDRNCHLALKYIGSNFSGCS
jgi:retron-type reverse transcriptase